MKNIILYCRSGFEKECAEEIIDKAAHYKIFGCTHAKKYSGYVVFESYRPDNADKLACKLPFNSLIFARQILVTGALLKNLIPGNRIAPIVGMLQKLIKKGEGLRVEVPDTNESKELMKFCRKFTVPLRSALYNSGILTNRKTVNYLVVHVFFIASNCCYTGYSYARNSSQFFMGIPRLRFPINSPSRSALKLEEAFHTFIPDNERNKRLNKGMHAVDLGACPGGWTYQLAKRNMQVISVDNGAIAKNVINTGRVTWIRKNGFHYHPNHGNISWMVCDILETPKKITALIIFWLIKGWCRETIFNFKLPMKRRYEEVLKNLRYIQEQLDKRCIHFEIQARQLYHNREEVTVHIRLL